METFLTILHALVAFLLISIILIQGGENVDVAAAFGGASQAAFGPRGAVTTFQKATWVLAAVFMATSVTLAIMATRRSGGSILETAPRPAAPAQSTPAQSPPSQPAPAQPAQ
jgi:preprotein translocase subunit SecG